MRGLRKTVNHGEYGSVALGLGQTGDEVQGDVGPRTVGVIAGRNGDGSRSYSGCRLHTPQ